MSRVITSQSNKSDKGLNDPTLERDIGEILKQYFLRDAFFDISANVPILIYFFVYGMPRTDEEIELANEDSYFKIFMLLKTLRLFHVYEVVQTLNRLLEKLADIFYLHRYLFKNLLSWAVAGGKFLLFVHYYACGWIYMQIWK